MSIKMILQSTPPEGVNAETTRAIFQPGKGGDGGRWVQQWLDLDRNMWIDGPEVEVFAYEPQRDDAARGDQGHPFATP